MYRQQFDALNKALIRDFNALTATTAAAGAASPLTLFTFELLLRLVFVAIFSHHWAAAEKVMCSITPHSPLPLYAACDAAQVRDEVSTPPTMAEVAARAQLMSLSYRHILSLLSLFLRLSVRILHVHPNIRVFFFFSRLSLTMSAQPPARVRTDISPLRLSHSASCTRACYHHRRGGQGGTSASAVPVHCIAYEKFAVLASRSVNLTFHRRGSTSAAHW